MRVAICAPSTSASVIIIILSYLNAVATKNVDIKYVKPEVTCPHCGRVIEEQEVEADSLVFTRAQLASLTLTSIN